MRRLLLALALTGFACGEASDLTDVNGEVDARSDVDQPNGEPFIQLGTGPRDFEPFSGTDIPTLVIVKGPQGGYHVWGGVAVDGVVPSNVGLEFEARYRGERVAGAYYVDTLSDRVVLGEREPYGYAGVAVILDAGVTPESLSGETLELYVTIEDSTGNRLSGEAQIKVECCEY